MPPSPQNGREKTCEKIEPHDPKRDRRLTLLELRHKTYTPPNPPYQPSPVQSAAETKGRPPPKPEFIKNLLKKMIFECIVLDLSRKIS